MQQDHRVGVQLPFVRARVEGVEQRGRERVAVGVGARVEADEQRGERLSDQDRVRRDRIAGDDRRRHRCLHGPGHPRGHERG
jgi:hypothetical protein